MLRSIDQVSKLGSRNFLDFSRITRFQTTLVKGNGESGYEVGLKQRHQFTNIDVILDCIDRLSRGDG